MTRLFLGMISGTSVDGVDAVICEFGDRQCRIVAAGTFSYPPAIEKRIQSLIESGRADLSEIGAIDLAVGRFFADAALGMIHQAGLSATDIEAIGHHGQTIWHQPDPPEPFSWQIGDPNSVAAITGIDTVADLRRLDMAVGGQGAPIVPAFHAWLFARPDRARVILNLGGIANVTVLAPDRPVTGFDTGPASTLLDAWCRRCLDQPYDDDGSWAATGLVQAELLDALRDEPYFRLEPPKSTGRELFNETWLKQKLAATNGTQSEADIAATLTELSASTITDAINALELPEFELIACGGGTRNSLLMKRIGERAGVATQTTSDHGVDPDWIEAAAMAWLARARIDGLPGNVPTVTAAREERVLGALYSGRRN